MLLYNDLDLVKKSINCSAIDSEVVVVLACRCHFSVCVVTFCIDSRGYKLRDFCDLCSNAIRDTILIRLAGEYRSNAITVWCCSICVLITLR